MAPTKAELVEQAEDLGIEVSEDMTKAEIESALEQASDDAAPAPVEEAVEAPVELQPTQTDLVQGSMVAAREIGEATRKETIASNMKRKAEQHKALARTNR